MSGARRAAAAAAYARDAVAMPSDVLIFAGARLIPDKGAAEGRGRGVAAPYWAHSVRPAIGRVGTIVPTHAASVVGCLGWPPRGNGEERGYVYTHMTEPPRGAHV